MPFEVACQSAVMADPAECPLDDPALGQHDEAMPVAAAHDLDPPAASAGHGGCHLRPLIAGVADDALDEGEQPPSLAQQRLGAVAILHIGRVHHHAEQQAERVGQYVALAAEGLLARIVARCIERRAPFCAPFEVWLSMIAVVGLASRPDCSRTAT